MITDFSVVVEKVIHMQLYDYLNQNSLLTERQYGFRKTYSTELAGLTW